MSSRRGKKVGRPPPAATTVLQPVSGPTPAAPRDPAAPVPRGTLTVAPKAATVTAVRNRTRRRTRGAVRLPSRHTPVSGVEFSDSDDEMGRETRPRIQPISAGGPALILDALSVLDSRPRSPRPLERRQQLLSVFRVGRELQCKEEDLSFYNAANLCSAEGWIATVLKEDIQINKVLHNEQGISVYEYLFQSTLSTLIPLEEITSELRTRFLSVLLQTHYIAADDSLPVAVAAAFLGKIAIISSKEIQAARYHAFRRP